MVKLANPEVIFLDAVGTLFGVRDSVGAIYSCVAHQFGVDVPAHLLNQSFRDSFRASPLPAFPGVAIADIPQQEYQWWRTIAAQTFTQAGVFEQFTNFDAFFADLYAVFASAEAWVLYPDVRPTLEAWCDLGIQLGIVSNFDSRLYAVLTALDLSDYFTTVTISTLAGVAKPNSQIFAIALDKAGSPHRAWHIGDSYTDDYQGAIAAGLRGIWLKRHDDSVPMRSIPEEVAAHDQIHSLDELVVTANQS